MDRTWPFDSIGPDEVRSLLRVHAGGGDFLAACSKLSKAARDDLGVIALYGTNPFHGDIGWCRDTMKASPFLWGPSDLLDGFNRLGYRLDPPEV